MLLAAVQEGHQVLVVLVAAAHEGRLQLARVQPLAETQADILGHFTVENDADGRAFLAAVDAHGDLLERTEVGVRVQLHFGVLRELEGVGPVVEAAFEAQEDERQAKADHVVQIHDVREAVAGRDLHPASVGAVRDLQEGVFLAQFAALRARGLFQGFQAQFFRHLHHEIDAVVFQDREVVQFVQPKRIHRAVQLVVEEVGQEGFLFRIQFVLGQDLDFVLLERVEHFGDRGGIFARIGFVEADDGLERLLDVFRLFAGRIAREHAVEGRHADTEEFVQIVRVDAQKRQTFQEGHLLFASLLQYAMIEIHPTYVAFDIGVFQYFVFSCHVAISLYNMWLRGAS